VLETAVAWATEPAHGPDGDASFFEGIAFLLN
jgi:hypothetical protein